MPIPTIEDIRNFGDAATTFHWNLEVVTVPVGVPLDTGFNLRLMDTDVPKSTGESIELNVRGHKVKQHGIYTPTQVLNMTLIETEDNHIHEVINTWKEICWDSRTGAQLSRQEVQCDLLLQRYDSDRNRIIWTYKLIGCFLEGFEIPQLNGASESLNPTVTLSYDYFLQGAGATVS